MTFADDFVNENCPETAGANPTDENPVKKKRGRPKKEKVEGEVEEKKPHQHEIHELIYQGFCSAAALALNRPRIPSRLPLPRTILGVVAPAETAARIPVEITDNVCRQLEPKEIAAAMLEYTRSLGPDFAWAKQDAAGAARVGSYWQLASSRDTGLLPDPVPVRFRGDTGLCYNRLPFRPEPGSTPIFEEFLGRINNGNAGALQAWIWSLFVAESYRQQFIWIRGEGNDGKSTLLRFLTWGFGNAALNQTEPPGADRFWAAAYLGKRVVTFPDVENFGSLDTSAWKQLTGGDDKIAIRPFGSPGYNAPLPVKIIVSSQARPKLSTMKASQRRIILVEMDTTDKFDPKYFAKWKKEAPAILYRCKEAYEYLCPNHEPIETSKESRSDLLSDARSEVTGEFADLEKWYDKVFAYKEGAEIAAAKEVQKLIEEKFPNTEAATRARNWLMNIRGHRIVRPRPKEGQGGDRPRYYKHLTIGPFRSRGPGGGGPSQNYEHQGF